MTKVTLHYTAKGTAELEIAKPMGEITEEDVESELVLLVGQELVDGESWWVESSS